MARNVPWSVLELERALKLKAQGLTWRAVGIRLGRTEKGLQITASRYRKGLWQPKRRGSSQAINDRIEDLVSSGVTTIHGVAQAIGVSDPAACRRLMRLGLDAEMRRAAAQSSCP